RGPHAVDHGLGAGRLRGLPRGFEGRGDEEQGDRDVAGYRHGMSLDEGPGTWKTGWGDTLRVHGRLSIEAARTAEFRQVAVAAEAPPARPHPPTPSPISQPYPGRGAPPPKSLRKNEGWGLARPALWRRRRGRRRAAGSAGSPSGPAGRPASSQRTHELRQGILDCAAGKRSS